MTCPVNKGRGLENTYQQANYSVHASGRELERVHAAQYTMDYSIRTCNGRLGIAEKGCNF